MQRLNRSAHAQVGTAFFLFLGLAILPVSLRVAGVQISFSPRLSAAIDAWQQIAEVFGAISQPPADFSVVRDLDSDPSHPVDDAVSPLGEFACARGPEDSAEKLPEKSNDVRDPRALNESPVRCASPKASRNPLAAKRVSVIVAGFEDHSRALGVLGAGNLETMMREELLKSIEKRGRPNLEATAEIRNLPIPISKSLRVLVRAKRVAASSSSKAAETKVFSALDSARRRLCDRAILTSEPSASPDNSEF